MPPRLFVLAILLFWGGTSSWLIYREILPRLRTGEAPPFVIDLTDEVGANTINWRVLSRDKEATRAGTGMSRVQRFPDRTFELVSEFKFEKMDFMGIRLTKVRYAYQVTADGKPLGLKGQFKFSKPGFKDLSDIDISVNASVENGAFKPTFLLNKQPILESFFKPKPFPVTETRNVFNPLHLVNKIVGLRAGQSWQAHFMDPVPVELDFPGRDMINKEFVIPELHAQVFDDGLRWPVDDPANEPVPCFRIDYCKPEDVGRIDYSDASDRKKKILVATWVRQRDNVVLKQSINFDLKFYAIDLDLIRENR